MAYRTIAFGLVATIVSVSTAEAGFLDWLFAPRKPAAPIAAAAPAHPAVTIRATPRKRVAQRAKAKPAVIYVDPKAQLAATIDPIANPDWHLIDPTLRKGDILVLADRVLVFSGGRIGIEANYVSLDKSRLISKKERLQVAEMTGHGQLPPLLAATTPPRQPKLLRQAEAIMPPVLGALPDGELRRCS